VKRENENEKDCEIWSAHTFVSFLFCFVFFNRLVNLGWVNQQKAGCFTERMLLCSITLKKIQ
jgi:hypothetical protein